jgi:hypothetical protein
MACLSAWPMPRASRLATSGYIGRLRSLGSTADTQAYESRDVSTLLLMSGSGV